MKTKLEQKITHPKHLPIIPVLVSHSNFDGSNATKRFNCLIDTGASHSYISQKIVEYFKLKKLDADKVVSMSTTENTVQRIKLTPATLAGVLC